MPVFKTTLTKFSAQAVAKVGTTAGWVVSAANNLGVIATIPAAQAASTLVLRITHMKDGDVISKFNLAGQLNIAAASTLDCQLRKMVPAAGSLTDSLVMAMTQISAAATPRVLDDSNSLTVLTTPETVNGNATYYLLITATTGAGCDFGLLGAVLHVFETYTK